MTTKELMALAKSKGITIKKLAEMTDISKSTLYKFNCGATNMCKEKQEKVREIISFLLNI